MGSVDPENKKIAQDMVKKYRSELRDHIKSNPNLRRKNWCERIEPMLDLRQDELIKQELVEKKIPSSIELPKKVNLIDIDTTISEPYSVGNIPDKLN